MRWGVMLVVCMSAGCAANAEPMPVETFEGELVLGTLDDDDLFVPYAMTDDGAYFVEVVRGNQGADMIVIVVELPDDYRGHRVDFACGVETAQWSSNVERTRLEDILVGDDQLLYAPYVILGWWDGEGADATITCEVFGPTRADVTALEARLTSAQGGE